MRRANPASERLRERHSLAVVDQDSVSQRDAPDDNLVSLRSHDVRRALASIVGCAELIHSGDLTDDQRRINARSLLREGRRLIALVDNALAMQRFETGHGRLDLAPVDIRAVILRAVFAAGEDGKRPIEVHVPEQLPLVWADAEAVLEVLANFLSNARAVSPDGGAITIGARQVGYMVEVYIRDHGAGVEAEALPDLVRGFYRADRRIRRLGLGVGLGLAVNYLVIEAHGGRVEASTKGPGTGTRFQFTLPISRPAATSLVNPASGL
jgi:two-component system sensor histidine kinase BaeS